VFFPLRGSLFGSSSVKEVGIGKLLLAGLLEQALEALVDFEPFEFLQMVTDAAQLGMCHGILLARRPAS
jgi:hypothetical protein